MGSAFQIEFVDPILFMRWFVPPDAESIDELLARLAELSAKHKKKLHCVVLIGEHLPVPDAEGRAALKTLFSRVDQYTHCVRLVFEGSSIKATMQRTIVEAAQMLARLRGGITYVHASGSDAVAAISKEAKLVADYMIMKAKSANILSTGVAPKIRS